MPQPIVKLKNLEITYNIGKENEYRAVHGVSMDVYPGEYVAFFGPSGCGKSTMFYSILGILEPSAGQLLVKGENPYSFSPERMVKFQTSTIGIIYQAFYLINSISVIDNVSLPQTFHNISPDRRKRWAKELLKRFGIEMHAEKYPDNLSGGQSQRVSVARSMVNNPDILLADEPTGNLDSISTKQVMDALETINMKDKKTVIMITHNAAQLKYCHRVFYMKDGLLQRTVPNPEKKQIAKIDRQKMLVTEMDLLSKLYPYDVPTTLKVKSVVNYITQNLPIELIIRLEEILAKAVEREIEIEQFYHLLTVDYSKGGVGLSNRESRRMADLTFKLLRQSEDVNRYRRRLEQNMFYEREEKILGRLAQYLADEMQKKPAPVQKRRLKDLVYSRISGLIRQDEFQRQLGLSLEQGGVGFTANEARAVNYHFEKIICQGIETKGHGH